MAKKNSPASTPSAPAKGKPNATSQPASGNSIIINDITVSQLFRGNQDIQRWYTALRNAENIYYPIRRELLQTYLDVSIDLHLTSCMDKRIRAVKTAPFVWKDLTNEVITENMQGLWWNDMLELIQSRIFWGPTLMEFIFEDGLISETILVPRQNVRPEFGIISKDGFSNDGFSYREGLYKNHILEVGKKTELGLLANLAPYVLMKRQNLSDFSRYNEMFGMPLRVYEYDPSMPGARAEVSQQAKEYGTAAYIVLPKGMGNVTFPEANQSSSSSAYDKLHSILNDEITIGVLGQVLTTSGTAKSSGQALGQVHKAVEQEMNLADKLYAEYYINYKLRKDILIPNGYPLQNITGRFKELDELPKEIRANMWVALLNAGVEIAEEDWHTEFDIPAPNGRPLTIVNKPINPADPAQQAEGEDPTDPQNPNPKTNGKGKQAAQQTKEKKGNANGLSAPGREVMDALYRGWFDKGFKVTLSSKRVMGTALDNVMKKVYNGTYKISDVDPDLYSIFADQLFSAVQKGFGVKLDKATPTEKDVLTALQSNVNQFAAYKDYQFIREAVDLLVDDTGIKKPQAVFEKDFQALSDRYYDLYSQVEIDTAEASAQMSAKWQSIQADKGTLPYLMFDAVHDDRTRVSHKELDGIVRPVDDPFWTNYYPPLDYNCRCTVRQLSDGEITSLRDKPMPQVKPMFQNNVGKTNVIFKDHPYMKINPADADKAYNDFGFGSSTD